MAELKPFRAYRYNSHTVPDVRACLAPMTEILTDAQAERLYERPDNAIHVARPRDAFDAARSLERWKHNEIISQDPLPAFYPYYQEFSLYGAGKKYRRKGFVAMLRLTENGSESIVVHEDILRQTIGSRVEMLREARANVTPVHVLYHDPAREVESILDDYMEQPLLEVVDQQGALNRLSMMQNKADLDQLREWFSGKKLFLADGHHRLAASRIFSQEQIEAADDPLGEDISQYIMAYFTNYAADDLRILPTHRLFNLAEDFDQQQFLEQLSAYFDIRSFDARTPVYQELDGEHTFGLMLQGKSFIAALKKEIDLEKEIQLETPFSVKRLEYTVVHYLIFDRILGLPYQEQAHSDRISYHKDYTTLVKEVSTSPDRLAVIVNEVSMDELLAVCEDGARMPQKSTYFFPKLVSGLLFASIHEKDYQSPFDSCF